MKRAIPSLLGLLLAAGCATEPGSEAEPGAQKPTPLRSAGGCECPASGFVASLTLDCYCAEFPNGCPSYDQFKTDVTSAIGYARCADGDESRWRLLEQTGCGRVEISTGWGLGGGTWTYDAVTHELIGVQSFSDLAFGGCQAAVYEAGVLDSCQEGSVCSLCDASGTACTPACSMELRTKSGAGTLAYDTLVSSPLNCANLEATSPRPELRVGCGHATVVREFGRLTYGVGTHEPVRVEMLGDLQCPAGWGEPLPACADEIVCSLCDGAADACTPAQLRAE